MNRVAWRRVLPICQLALYAALIVQGERFFDDLAFLLNLPALIMTLPLTFLLFALGCPEQWAAAISLAVFWYLAGRAVDTRLKSRSVERTGPYMMRPLYGWIGLIYSGLVGGFLWLKAIEAHDPWHSSDPWFWSFSLLPLSLATYYGWKLVQWRNAHRPPLCSITQTR